MIAGRAGATHPIRPERLTAVAFSAVRAAVDPATRQPVGEPLRGHSGTVTAIAYSPDGSLLAIASDDPTVRLWEMRDGSG